MRHHCPHCRTALDDGPIVYRCSRCRRAVFAADLDTEFRPLIRHSTGEAQT
jgi:hypothetical protein